MPCSTAAKGRFAWCAACASGMLSPTYSICCGLHCVYFFARRSPSGFGLGCVTSSPPMMKSARWGWLFVRSISWIL